jgi:HPt (histidine-containing phosphotransfer) domain-containing protein
MNTQSAPAQLGSVFDDDADLSAQLAAFARHLPERIDALRSAAKSADWESVAAGCRRLQRTSKCYGYLAIAAEAARIERAAGRTTEEAEIVAAIQHLAELCGQLHRAAE